MTENEAASAEVLIWTASPVIVLSQQHRCSACEHSRRNVIHGGPPLSAAARFLAATLLHEPDVSAGEGEPQQLVQLSVCLV